VRPLLASVHHSRRIETEKCCSREQGLAFRTLKSPLSTTPVAAGGGAAALPTRRPPPEMAPKAVVALEHGLLDLESRGKLQRPFQRLSKLLHDGTENLEAKLAAHMDLVARADEALASRAVDELRRDAEGLGAAVRRLERRDPSGVARMLGIQNTISLEAEALAAREPFSQAQSVASVSHARSQVEESRKAALREFHVKTEFLLAEARQELGEGLAEASRMAGLRVDTLAGVELTQAQAKARMRELSRSVDALGEALLSSGANGRAICRKREESHAALLNSASRRINEQHKALRRVADGTEEQAGGREALRRGRRALRRSLMGYLMACNERAAEQIAAAGRSVDAAAAAAEELKQEQRRRMERTLALANAVEDLRGCLPSIS